MSSTEYVGPLPLDSPAPAAHRPTLGPGYDWLIELMRQLGRPAAFFLCLVAMVFQITAPPEARMDALTHRSVTSMPKDALDGEAQVAASTT